MCAVVYEVAYNIGLCERKTRWFMGKLFNCGSMDKPENTINHGWWSISFYFIFIHHFLSFVRFLFLFNCPLCNLTVISRLFYSAACLLFVYNQCHHCHFAARKCLFLLHYKHSARIKYTIYKKFVDGATHNMNFYRFFEMLEIRISFFTNLVVLMSMFHKTLKTYFLHIRSLNLWIHRIKVN